MVYPNSFVHVHAPSMACGNQCIALRPHRLAMPEQPHVYSTWEAKEPQHRSQDQSTRHVWPEQDLVDKVLHTVADFPQGKTAQQRPCHGPKVEPKQLCVVVQEPHDRQQHHVATQNAQNDVAQRQEVFHIARRCDAVVLLRGRRFLCGGMRNAAPDRRTPRNQPSHRRRWRPKGRSHHGVCVQLDSASLHAWVQCHGQARSLAC